jgi:hypothetical protein
VRRDSNAICDKDVATDCRTRTENPEGEHMDVRTARQHEEGENSMWALPNVHMSGTMIVRIDHDPNAAEAENRRHNAL